MPEHLCPNPAKREKMNLYCAAYPYCPAARYAPHASLTSHNLWGPQITMEDVMTDYNLMPNCFEEISSETVPCLNKTDVIMYKLFRKETLLESTEEIDFAIRNSNAILTSTFMQSSSSNWHRERSFRINNLILG
jgi:hypothetical protein